MNMKNKQYRQGDVLVERVKAIPSTAQALQAEGGRMVLAHGEVTGHSHSICERDGRMAQESGVTYLEIRAAVAMLQHQEHATVEIPRGTYRVTRQREYTPEEVRNVAD